MADEPVEPATDHLIETIRNGLAGIPPKPFIIYPGNRGYVFDLELGGDAGLSSVEKDRLVVGALLYCSPITIAALLARIEAAEARADNAGRAAKMLEKEETP